MTSPDPNPLVRDRSRACRNHAAIDTDGTARSSIRLMQESCSRPAGAVLGLDGEERNVALPVS